MCSSPPTSPFLCFSHCLTIQTQFQNPQAVSNFASWQKLFPQAGHKSGEFELFLGLWCPKGAGGRTESKPINWNHPERADLGTASSSSALAFNWDGKRRNFSSSPVRLLPGTFRKQQGSFQCVLAPELIHPERLCREIRGADTEWAETEANRSEGGRQAKCKIIICAPVPELFQVLCPKRKSAIWKARGFVWLNDVVMVPSFT